VLASEQARYGRVVRRLFLLVVLVLGLAACGGSKPVVKAQAIAFGTGPRHPGGSYAVIIRRAGAVHPESAAVSRGHVPSSQVASLTGLAQQEFDGGLAGRLCPGAPPETDRFIDAAGHNAYVRGNCEPRFNELWNALAKAVGLRTR
jgi:hypothetical protein